MDRRQFVVTIPRSSYVWIATGEDQSYTVTHAGTGRVTIAPDTGHFSTGTYAIRWDSAALRGVR